MYGSHANPAHRLTKVLTPRSAYPLNTVDRNIDAKIIALAAAMKEMKRG
jgi:hypothetical protein